MIGRFILVGGYGWEMKGFVGERGDGMALEANRLGFCRFANDNHDC